MNLNQDNLKKGNWIELITIMILVMVFFAYDSFVAKQKEHLIIGDLHVVYVEEDPESPVPLENNPFVATGNTQPSFVSADSESTGLGTIPTACLFDINARPGDYGPHVFHIQNFLYHQGYLTEKPNGFYGSATGAAVRAFQAAYPETWQNAGLSGPTAWFYKETRTKAQDVCEIV